MDKKGFTLVELLAVIVILALLALLTSTAITKLVSDSKNELSNIQINSIKEAAKAWGADNINKLPDAGECIYMTLEDLKEYGLLDSSVINPNNNQEFSNDLKVKITSTTSEYGKPIINYEVNPDSIDGCVEFYAPVCTIERQVAGTYTVGDVVTCGEEQFYVIENQDTDTTTGIDILAMYTLTLTENPIQNKTGYVNAIAFSTTNYWESTVSSYPAYVYGNYEENNIYPYVSAYETYLKNNLGVSSASATLINHEQFKSSICPDGTEWSCPNAPSWIFSSSYWTGSAYGAYGVWLVDSQGSFNDMSYKALSGFDEYGIRPVITIQTSDLD